MTTSPLPLPETIRLIDTLHMGQPEVIGSYLLLGDEPALVDPGPASTLPTLLKGLDTHGVTLGDLRTIVLTHIHLDHAGATGVLLAQAPHLHVYVHTRGAPHLIAPERLISSASRLYGEMMGPLWGEILPVPADHVTVLSGGERLQAGGRTLLALDTPGHASHHLAYLDETSGALFSGDVAGVRLPGAPHARPPTPPPDIDLPAWAQSLESILSVKPEILLMTHFGPSGDPAPHIADLHHRLSRWAERVRESLVRGESEAEAVAALRALADSDFGPGIPADLLARYEQAMGIEQSWHGLARYWRKRPEGLGAQG